MKHLEMKIFGKVQGVFFRASATKVAKSLGLVGYVKNLPDGTLEIVAEGEVEKLEKFLAWCRRGPQRAEVERLDYEFLKKIERFETFETRR